MIANSSINFTLLSSEFIDNAIELLLKNPNADSVITVVNDPHLGWQKINNKIIPKNIKKDFAGNGFWMTIEKLRITLY